MMKKVFIGVAVATVLVCANPAKADAKVVTVKAAAKEMVKVSDKAYKDRKTHTVKFTLKGSISKVWDVYDEAVKIEKGEAAGKCFAAASPIALPKFEKWGTQSDKNGTYKFVKGNGSFTYSVTFSGKNKRFRTEYLNNLCAKKIAKEIKKITKGKNQKMKAIIVMDWLAERAYAHRAKNGFDYKTDATDVYKGKAYSQCDGLAYLWKGLARIAGIKKCGCVSSNKMNHMWNWLEVDGKKYYLEFQETPDWSIEYDRWCDFDPNNCDDEELKECSELYADNQKYYGLPLAWEVSKEEYCLWTKKEAMRFYGDNGKDWEYPKS